MRRVLVFTGSRGEWGYLRPVLAEFKNFGLTSYIVATNMHVDSKFGATRIEIERDGFSVDESLPMGLAFDSKFRWSYELGLFASQIAGVIERAKADLILVAGDRAETMAAVVVSYYTDIPICHIQAGEKSGHKDGAARHAIGKLAHVHFASNSDAYDRLCALGEERFRIYNVGAPQIDDLLDRKFVDSGEDVVSNLRLPSEYVLSIFHASSEDGDALAEIANDINCAIADLSLHQVWILPNSDAGSEKLYHQITAFNRAQCTIVRNLPRNEFAYLLKGARCLIGNSSVGVLEAPTIGTWSINIGYRQEGRLRSSSIMDLPEYDRDKFLELLARSLEVAPVEKNYGDGSSAKRICQVLSSVEIDEDLINKRITV